MEEEPWERQLPHPYTPDIFVLHDDQAQNQADTLNVASYKNYSSCCMT